MTDPCPFHNPPFGCSEPCPDPRTGRPPCVDLTLEQRERLLHPPPKCYNEHASGMICTRDKGHKGDHSNGAWGLGD